MKYYFEKGGQFEQIYVSDYYKLTKIDAKSAFYVSGSNVFGPMGNELIPFASEEDAKTFTRDHYRSRQCMSFCTVFRADKTLHSFLRQIRYEQTLNNHDDCENHWLQQQRSLERFH